MRTTALCRWLRDNAKFLAFVLLFGVFRTAIADWNPIPSASMHPNLLEGDVVFVNRLAFDLKVPLTDVVVAHTGDPRRGDVVTFFSPQDGMRLIKRVIGLPGQTVELRNKKVYIDGKPIDEPYVHFLIPPSTAFQEITSSDVRENYGPVTVPPEQYFVMGDNRDNSEDSRYWGFLPRNNVKGKALIIYWSYESGREDYVDEGYVASAKRLGSVFVHFFTRTRWERLFHQIR